MNSRLNAKNLVFEMAGFCWFYTVLKLKCSDGFLVYNLSDTRSKQRVFPENIINPCQSKKCAISLTGMFYVFEE